MTEAETGIEASFSRELGRRLKIRRRELKLSRREVGFLVGVHQNTILRWEDGDGVVTVWQLLRVADVLQRNFIMLLPDRSYTWGGLENLERERNLDLARSVQAERDPMPRAGRKTA